VIDGLSAGAKLSSYDLSRVGTSAEGPDFRPLLPGAPWSETWPAPGATLDLDFANDRGYVRGVGQGGVMDAITFTRASNGNYVKPDGTLSSHANQGALGNNLLTFPQDFDNAAWQKFNVTVEKDAEIAPNGTLTAENLKNNAVSNNAFYIDTGLSNIPTTIGLVTASIYFKKNTSDFAYLQMISATVRYAVVIDLANGTFGSSDTGGTSPSGTSYSIVSDGDWHRLSITMDNPNNSTRIFLGISNSATPTFLNGRPLYTSNGTESIFIWGAQLELGSTATEYFPTNIGLPRFDWASTEQVPQNKFLRFTEEFDNNYWQKEQLSVIENIEIAPDGNNTADKIIEDSNDGEHLLAASFNSQILTLGFTYSASIYAKADERHIVCIQARRGALTCGVKYNLLTLEIQEVPDGGSILNSGIEVIGGGWYRCFVTFTVISAFSFKIGMLEEFGFPVRESFRYQGDGSSGLFLWGAQLEISDNTTQYQAIGSSIPYITPLKANPTSNGLLKEEARTNPLLWNRDATQAQWVKTDITAVKDQTGIDGVANSASSLTATDDNGTCIQTITLGAGNRTGSVYLKRLTGTGLIQVTLDGSTYSTVELSDAEWRRIVLSGNVTNPTVGIRLAENGDAVAMDYGQVEDGLFATTPILTTTATVARSAEIISISLNNAIDIRNGTVKVNFVPYTNTNAGTIFEIGDQINRISLYNTTAGRLGMSLRSRNVTYSDSNGLLNAIVDGTNNKLSSSWSSRNLIRASNSGVFDQRNGVFSPDISIQQFTQITANNSTNMRITYWPIEMNLTQIQELLK
jgi:hypothetical protein